MSSRIKMWQISNDDVPIPIETDFGQVNLEARLESWIEKTPGILGEELLIVGRQFGLSTGESVDLLALDRDGNIVVIELKRQKSTREVIAQALDYEALISKMSEEELNDKVSSYFEKRGYEWESLRESFERKFQNKDAAIGNARRILIVAPSLDLSTERIVNYLASQYDMDINGISFAYYKDETGKEFVIRNVMLSELERKEREGRKYPLQYHLGRAKDFFKSELEALFSYFKDKGFELHSVKNYVTIYKGDIYFGFIRPRKTLAHLTVSSDYPERLEIERLENLSRQNEDFEIGYSDEWVTRDGGKIIEWIRIDSIRDLETIRKYDDEVQKAIESLKNYYENEERIVKLRTRVEEASPT